jgi:hypothetical protein
MSVFPSGKLIQVLFFASVNSFVQVVIAIIYLDIPSFSWGQCKSHPQFSFTCLKLSLCVPLLANILEIPLVAD